MGDIDCNRKLERDDELSTTGNYQVRASTNGEFPRIRHLREGWDGPHCKTPGISQMDLQTSPRTLRACLSVRLRSCTSDGRCFTCFTEGKFL